MKQIMALLFVSCCLTTGHGDMSREEGSVSISQFCFRQVIDNLPGLDLYFKIGFRNGDFCEQSLTFDRRMIRIFVVSYIVTHYNLTLSYPTLYLNLMHCGRCVHQLMLIGTEQ